MSPLFSVTDVSYRYDDILALNKASFEISAGRCVALLGANGSGKSTVLRLLSAIAFAQNGRVVYRDRDLSADRFADAEFACDFHRQVGILFQNPDVQLFNASVFDEVAFGPLQLCWPRRQVAERVQDMMNQMEIEHLRDRPPHRLSGGEKKRVALASVLVLDPEVLLLDEPTASLDPRGESMMIDSLAGFKANKTLVIATHDLDLVRTLADECIALSEGRIVATGHATSILQDEELLERANLIKRRSSPTNVRRSCTPLQV